jgi:two-component sensor histidine kinase
VRGIEATTERPDGTLIPILPHPTPLYDETGMMVGAVNMLVDVGERKRAEEEHALLVRELHHRVKNTLATVQAIMGATARSAGSTEQFKDAMIGRISSLARTHLLLSDEGGVAMFGDIVRKELNAFDDGSGERIRLNGPAVDLPSPLAVSLGMALHELATNAAKHGSLSVPSGAVAVTWKVADKREALTLEIDWVESGGPPVSEPARHGFGSRLLNFVLPGQINAVTHVEYQPDGVQVHCAVPLSRTGGSPSRQDRQ